MNSSKHGVRATCILEHCCELRGTSLLAGAPVVHPTGTSVAFSWRRHAKLRKRFGGLCTLGQGSALTLTSARRKGGTNVDRNYAEQSPWMTLHRRHEGREDG